MKLKLLIVFIFCAVAVQTVVKAQSDTLYFAEDKYTLTNEHKSKLDVFLKNIDTILYVDGYADMTGTNKYNKELSKNRIKSVLNYVSGVEKFRIDTTAHGEEEANQTIQKAKDRKIVLKIRRDGGVYIPCDTCDIFPTTDTAYIVNIRSNIEEWLKNKNITISSVSVKDKYGNVLCEASPLFNYYYFPVIKIPEETKLSFKFSDNFIFETDLTSLQKTYNRFYSIDLTNIKRSQQYNNFY